MASSSNKKSKSSGLRILWIPGSRKSHPKGRYSSTNKHISYSSGQKKSQVWSLGGSKAQRELLDFPSPENSSSSLTVLGAASCASVAATQAGESLPPQNGEILTPLSECATLPATPTTSTHPHPTSPSPTVANETGSSKNIVTTAEILDFHNHFDPNDLPKVPSHSLTDLSTTGAVLNSSAGTTASIATSTSPQTVPSAEQEQQQAGSLQASPHKQRSYRNQNNNHEDINSIESISSCQRSNPAPISFNFDWIDEMVMERNCQELMHKNKRKKSKKLKDSAETDQLDGKNYKFMEAQQLPAAAAKPEEDEEKVVKCLYYSLMCCDCTIS